MKLFKTILAETDGGDGVSTGSIGSVDSPVGNMGIASRLGSAFSSSTKSAAEVTGVDVPKSKASNSVDSSGNVTSVSSNYSGNDAKKEAKTKRRSVKRLKKFKMRKFKDPVNEDLSQDEVTELTQTANDRLARAEKMDSVDTVCFGIETDDDRIVKVFVKQEQADAFEVALAKSLAEHETIEDSLNELSSEFEIIDVEWPKDDGSSSESDDLGADSLESEVYDNPAEEEDEEHKPNREKQQVAESVSQQIRLSTGLERTIFQILVELGISDDVLRRPLNRREIIDTIKNSAERIKDNAQIVQAVRLLARKLQNEKEDQKDDKPEKEVKRKDDIVDDKPIKEDVANESKQMLVSRFVSELLHLIDRAPDHRYADAVLSLPVTRQLFNRSQAVINKELDAGLRLRLKRAADILSKMNEPEQVNESMATDLQEILEEIFLMIDATAGKILAKKIFTTPAWRQLMNSVRTQANKVSGTLRTQLMGLKQALETKKLKEAVEGWTARRLKNGFITFSTENLFFTIDDPQLELMLRAIVDRDVFTMTDLETPRKKIIMSPRSGSILFKQVGDKDGVLMSSKELDDLIDEVADLDKDKKKDDKDDDKAKDDKETKAKKADDEADELDDKASKDEEPEAEDEEEPKK